MRTTPTETAILLIAHGSRRDQTNHELKDIQCKILAQELYPIVEVGYRGLMLDPILKSIGSKSSKDFLDWL